MKKIIYTLMLIMACTTTVSADKNEKKGDLQRPDTETFNYKRAIEALNANNLDEAISYFSKEI